MLGGDHSKRRVRFFGNYTTQTRNGGHDDDGVFDTPLLLFGWQYEYVLMCEMYVCVSVCGDQQ